jgi:hypothetical protein
MTEQMFVAGYVGNGRFIAFKRFWPTIDKMYQAGDRVVIEIYDARNVKWEKKFFAVVGTAWANLPPDIQAEFPSANELRYHALIQLGYRHETRGVMASNKEALRYISQPRSRDDYVLFSVNGAVVVEWRPMSMRRDSMRADVFQRASEEVIAHIAKMLGVTEKELLSSHRGDKISPALSEAPGDAPSVRSGRVRASTHSGEARSKPEDNDRSYPPVESSGGAASDGGTVR